jgi:hypothetical protein
MDAKLRQIAACAAVYLLLREVHIVASSAWDRTPPSAATIARVFLFGTIATVIAAIAYITISKGKPFRAVPYLSTLLLVEVAMFAPLLITLQDRPVFYLASQALYNLAVAVVAASLTYFALALLQRR